MAQVDARQPTKLVTVSPAATKILPAKTVITVAPTKVPTLSTYTKYLH